MTTDRVRSLLQEIRRRRGEDFDARDYFLSEPSPVHHYAIEVEWIPGYGYTSVLSTQTEPGNDRQLAKEAMQRGVVSGDDANFIKSVKEINAQEANRLRSSPRRAGR